MKKVFYNKNHTLINFALIWLFLFTSTSIRSQDSLSCTKVGQWAEGPCYAAASIGHYAFLNDGCYLVILDITAPDSPVEVSKYLTRGVINNMRIKGNYVYAAINKFGLEIIDINDYSNPHEVAFLKIGGIQPKIDIQDNKLFYYAFSKQIEVIDISDPLSPAISSRIKFNNSNLRIYKLIVKNNYAFISAGWSGFIIYDISNYDSPVEIFKNGGIFGYDVDIQGDYACIAADDSTLIYNISNPQNSYITAKITGYLNNKYIKCKYHDNLLIIGGYVLGLFDISDQTNPVFLSKYNTRNNIYDIEINNNLMMIANGDAKFKIIDFHDNNNLSLLSTYDTKGYSYGIAKKDNIVYIAQYNRGLSIINVSDPHSPYFIKSIDSLERLQYIKVKDNLLFCSSSGLKIYDISTPENPVYISSYNIPGHTTGDFILRNKFIYFGAGTKGLIILDISDIHNPVKTGEYTASGFVQNLDIKDNLAVLGCSDGLKFIDISDPTYPFEIGAYNIYTWIRAVKLIDNYVYLGGGTKGLTILDIKDISNPKIIKDFHKTIGYNLITKDNILFVPEISYYLTLYDISNPEIPEKIAYYKIQGNAYDIILDDDYIYATSSSAGMTILDFDKCNTIVYSKNIENILCQGDCNGSISIDTIKRGTPPYLFQWSTGQTGNTVTNLCAGKYTVTMTDNNNCIKTYSFFISEPDSFYIKTIVKQDITDSNSKGHIGINIAGGTPDYIFEWSDPNDFSASTQNITGLDAGCYTLTVTDANGCTLVSDDICIEDKRTAVEDIENDNDFQIYPNPAKNHIYIYSKDTDFANSVEKIEIFDSSGLKVKEYNKGTKTIDINELNNGFYMIQLTFPGQKIIKKLNVLK